MTPRFVAKQVRPKTRISVVLATWNGGRFLRSQLKSIECQTYPVDQIIIRDDGSNDDTYAICQSFKSRFANLDFSTNKFRLGPASNFMSALRSADGDIIILCDQDDIWKVNKVEAIVDSFQKYDCLAAYHSASLVDGSGRDLGVRFPDLKDCRSAEVSALRPIYGMALAFSSRLQKLFVGEYGNLINDTCGHDCWIYTVATLFGDVCHISEVLSYYRQHDANFTGIPRRQSYVVGRSSRIDQYRAVSERMSALLNAVEIWERDGVFGELSLNKDVIDYYRHVKKTYDTKTKINQPGNGFSKFEKIRSIIYLMNYKSYREDARMGLSYKSLARDIFSIII